jgi:hypothetical protein
MKRNEISPDPRYLGVPSGASRMMFEPMVRSMQNVHLSWVKNSPISKWTELNFHLSLVTYHRVWPKWFLCWWYVWSKPCTNLAPTLILSPKRIKWDSTWPTSPRSSIGCVKNDFRAMVHSMQTVHPLASRLALCLKGSKWASTWASSPSGAIGCVQNDLWAYGTSSAKHALTLSPNGKKWDSSWPTSPRSSIECVQTDVWAYGMFDTNCATILRQG